MPCTPRPPACRLRAGAQRAAAAAGVALVAPDTSPRGLGVAGEAEAWDFGVGAGFYLNATQEPWSAWRMDDYVSSELPALLASALGGVLDMSRRSMVGARAQERMGAAWSDRLSLRRKGWVTLHDAAPARMALCAVLACPLSPPSSARTRTRTPFCCYDMRARMPTCPALPCRALLCCAAPSAGGSQHGRSRHAGARPARARRHVPQP